MARATWRPGWEASRSRRAEDSVLAACSGFSVPKQVRHAAPGGRETLTLHVRPSIPGNVYSHVFCRIWGPCRPTTSHVGLGARVHPLRSM